MRCAVVAVGWGGVGWAGVAMDSCLHDPQLVNVYSSLFVVGLFCQGKALQGPCQGARKEDAIVAAGEC